jgi:hypothetical protein
VLDPWRQTLKLGRMGDRIGQAVALVESDAVIVCDWEQATALWYYQQVEGLRPDVLIAYPVNKLEALAQTSRPLYLARAHAGLVGRWVPSSVGPLVALHPEPVTELPSGVMPLGLGLGSMLELAGYVYGPGEHTPASVVPLSLYWRVLDDVEHDYSVSLRLFDAEGVPVFQVDSQHPVLGTHPTSRWRAGQVIGDYYEIQLAPDLSPGTYRWGVVAYRALQQGGWEGLPVDGTGREVALGGSLDVVPRARAR